MRNPRAWWRGRRAARDARDEARVAGVLWHEEPLSGWPLMDKTGLSGGRLYAALVRMERYGRVTSWWRPGPAPRRRMYALAQRPTAMRLVGDTRPGRLEGSDPGA